MRQGKWKKRGLSFVLVLAMVLTQLGTWGAETVKADGKSSSVSLYFEYAGDGIPAVQIWNGTWDYLSPTDDTWVKVDSTDYCEMNKVSDASNWYSITFSYDDTSVQAACKSDSKTSYGFGIYAISTDSSSATSIASYGSIYTYTSAFASIFGGTYNCPAIMANDRTTVVSFAETYELTLTSSATNTVNAGDSVTVTPTVTLKGASITKISSGYSLCYTITDGKGTFSNGSNELELTPDETTKTLAIENQTVKMTGTGTVTVKLKKDSATDAIATANCTITVTGDYTKTTIDDFESYDASNWSIVWGGLQTALH